MARHRSIARTVGMLARNGFVEEKASCATVNRNRGEKGGEGVAVRTMK